MEAILQVARSSIAIEENLIYHQIPQQPNAFQNKTKAKGEKPSNSFLHVMSKNYAKVHGGSIQVYEFFNCILNTEKLRYVPSVDYNIWLGYEMLNKHFVSLKESLVVSLQPPGRLKILSCVCLHLLLKIHIVTGNHLWLLQKHLRNISFVAKWQIEQGPKAIAKYF